MTMPGETTVQQLWLSLASRVNSDERMTPALAGFLPLVEPKGIIEQTLYLEVPNDFTRNMIDTRLRTIIPRAHGIGHN
jgi:chromosomal replication initiator protein